MNSWPDKPKSVKECTEALPNTPLRVRKVAYRIKTNVATTSANAVRRPVRRFCHSTMACSEATSTSQGMYTAFSTGSQFQ